MNANVEGTLVSQTWLDEERLMVERARRCPQAFAEIYTRYSGRVYSYAYKRTKSHADAEDITSETFALALEGLPKYEWRNVPFSAWLFRIASNQVAMYFRRRRPELGVDDVVLEDTDSDPQLQVLWDSQVDELRQAVLHLKVDQRRAVELRYNQGLRAKEIASELGRTEGSVKLLLHRATLSLRQQLLPLSA
ncbi:MAG: sigma-70 family RNA polymerase sigma factor [Chloroflexota bacterium]|nr:sigma-70 family RNA polymerase sigma factor [Chloroflexota bacterium]